MYTMMQVCRELGMTYQTLKFYCNEGLVPNVKRDHNNRRVFDEKDVKWIKDLTCLKKCGMSIQEMKKYLELCLQGEATIVSRKKMLARKQEELRASIKELEDSISYIGWKQNFYDEVLSGKRPYVVAAGLFCRKMDGRFCRKKPDTDVRRAGRIDVAGVFCRTREGRGQSRSLH